MEAMTHASSVTQIQGTNDSSILSKSSMVRHGYFNDEYIQKFAAKKTRRSPIIHWGYYIRAKAVDHVFKTFCEHFREDRFQIISYGAGFDSSYFRLKDNGVLPEWANYIEIDFPEVVLRKKELILKEEKLKALLGNHTDESTYSKNVFLYGDQYRLLAADLGDLATLDDILKNAGLDFRQPTLLLSECAITYMEEEKSMSLIRWSATRFPYAIFATYEQVHPSDGFGAVMCHHFNSLHSPLRSISKYPNNVAQEDRYKQAGWSMCRAVGMNLFYERMVPDEEKKRVESLEPFDEFEVWHLKCSHYILICACKCMMSHVLDSVIPERSFDVPFRNLHFDEITWTVKTCDVKSFGSCGALVNTHHVLIVGGFGETSGQHSRIPELSIIDLTDFNVQRTSLTDENSSSLIHCDIMYGSVCVIDDSVIVIGGRFSPFQPLCNILVIKNLNCFSENISSLRTQIVLNFGASSNDFGNYPSPRWRHTCSVVQNTNRIFLFGGITAKKQILDDAWLLDTSTWMWEKVSTVSHKYPRFSHAVSSWKSDQLIISGGLGSSEKSSVHSEKGWSECSPLSDILILDLSKWKFTKLLLSGVLPRYSHTSHVIDDTLFLIGGVNTIPTASPGIAVINLHTRICQEFKLPVTNPSSPILLHSHMSVYDSESCSIIVFGGGANCFSFGTHLNPGIIKIPCHQFMFV